jgi:type II secretory pathway component GspD/PulD (secretin)
MQQPAAVAESAVDETKAARDMAELAEMAAANDEGEVRNRPGAPIVAAPGPGGTIIASEDLDALDALEQMLSITAGTSFGSTREYAVFYLKYAKAAATAETLSTMFGGGAAGGGGGGGLMGGIANAALGDLGGGLMGDLLGLGGTSSVTGFSAGSVDIVADTRLNLLLVYAQPQDIETVNQVLEILDQSEGPEEVEALGKPRLIPVYNTSAASIADVVRSVYSDRLEGGGGGGNQPSPQDILRALSRGQGGRGGGGADQEPEKMTIGVDERSNALVVRASDPLFGQVEALVRQLDEQQRDSSQSTQIISLKFSNSDAVKQALAGVFGADAIKSSGNSSSRPSSTEPSGGGGDDARRAAEETQRRIEMFRAMQQRMQQGGGGPPGGGRGGPPGGGEGGGRGGRGGRG